MNVSTNISSDPKLLTNPAPPEPRHCLSPVPFCTIESIHLRAETVTPTLQGILDYWPPEHWESNQ